MNRRFVPLFALSMTVLAGACGDRILAPAGETGSGQATDSSTTGDGDPTDDGDPTGDGDPGGSETDTADMECVDLDQDGYGLNCDLGPDCDDADYHNHTEEGCANCMDADLDEFWSGCDRFDDDKPGPDCDDGDFSVFSEQGCAQCTDNDNDGTWVGCDQYHDAKPGPDCDDDNPNVGIGGDLPELCNGLAESCGGARTIDDDPPEEMCAIHNAPNVETWACNPPAPGVDGCEIVACVEGYWDLDSEVANGCESDVPG